MSDPAKYRSKDELDSYKEQDPIVFLERQLIEEKLADKKTLQSMDDEAKKISADSVKFAEESCEPSIDSLHQDIYA